MQMSRWFDWKAGARDLQQPALARQILPDDSCRSLFSLPALSQGLHH